MQDFFVIPDPVPGGHLLFYACHARLRTGISFLQAKNFYVYYRNVIAKAITTFVIARSEAPKQSIKF